MRFAGKIGLAVLTAWALGACHADAGDKPDLAVAAGPLALTITLSPPQLEGLMIAEGRLELHHVSLFGDVSADNRTMLGETGLGLPKDALDVTFPSAPYGLYSRVQTSVDDVQLHGAWRGTPLEVGFEVESFHTIDLRGPALDYEPTMGARFTMPIDANQWFDAARLDVATVTDGAIHVNWQENVELTQALVTAVEASFSLDGTSGPMDR